MATEVPQQPNNADRRNMANILTEKTEQPSHTIQNGMITPPMSPANASFSKRESKVINSAKTTSEQTGLPWLARDADRETQIHALLDQNATSPVPQNSTSPPPKFLARPKTGSLVRIPTKKRTMQKHVYSMSDGLDPVKVLIKRMSTWQSSVKYLINMFRSIKKVEATTGKGYRKIDTNFEIPSKIADQFKSSDGVKDAWIAFRRYTRENSLIHQDFVDFIENEVESTLENILKDIANFIASLKRNSDLKTNSLWNCRKVADKAITGLNSEIYSTTNTQEKEKSDYVLVKRDPLLLKYTVIKAIQVLYEQENRLHGAFLQAQDNYRQFEQNKIINAYKGLFRNFENYRIEHNLEKLESVVRVVQIFDAIETDSEWIDFVQHHKNELVKPTSAFKNNQALDFPNSNHPLVQPIMMGPLQRRQHKKWIDEYFVLSRVGQLHKYKSETDFFRHPLKPEVTLFIPQCTMLIVPNVNLLKLNGKPVGGTFFDSKKLYELSSHDGNAIRQWVQLMDPISLQLETAVNSHGPEATITEDNASNAVAVEDHNVSGHDEIQQDAAAGVSKSGIDREMGSDNINNVQGNAPIHDQSMSLQQQENVVTPIATNHEQNVITSSPDHIGNQIDNEDEDEDDFKGYETIEHSPYNTYLNEEVAGSKEWENSVGSGEIRRSSIRTNTTDTAYYPATG